jgi:uncharacterized membrane protein YqjE
MDDPMQFGRITEKVQVLEHRARNDRQIIQLLEAELELLRLELERLKARAFTALGVLGIVASVLAWVIERKITNVIQ